MGVVDQKQFADAVAQAKAVGQIVALGDHNSRREEWVAALRVCDRLAMADILAALWAMNPSGKEDMQLLLAVATHRKLTLISRELADRIEFAITVVSECEIQDFGLPDDQVNDGRQFLGCTRLDDDGVRKEIHIALSLARPGPTWRPDEPCCGRYKAAWIDVLVPQRKLPGRSLNANLAAAAHYMLARYHVCAAHAWPSQMKVVIDGYDLEKSRLIAKGDRDLKGLEITPGSRPFPPDFAVRNWAYIGADDGVHDRMRCN